MLKQKQINELNKLVEYLVDKGFTDMVDVSAEESFIEYGRLRNPDTDQVVYCMPGDGDFVEIALDWSIVDIDDVKEYLEESATVDFYSCIGSTKEKELAGLNNSYLSGMIHVMNMYSGYFQQSCTWDYDVETIKTILDN